jgi:hypothetical protein
MQPTSFRTIRKLASALVFLAIVACGPPQPARSSTADAAPSQTTYACRLDDGGGTPGAHGTDFMFSVADGVKLVDHDGYRAQLWSDGANFQVALNKVTGNCGTCLGAPSAWTTFGGAPTTIALGLTTPEGDHRALRCSVR